LKNPPELFALEPLAKTKGKAVQEKMLGVFFFLTYLLFELL
jgi:hypothetical protein